MFGLNKDTPVVGKAETLVKRSTNDIFSFVGANFIKNYPRWSPEVIDLTLLTDGSVRVGTQCRQVRIDQGKRSESTFEVTVFQPGKRICFEGVSNPYRCDYILNSDKEPSESKISFTFELLKLELFMRPFEKLIRVAVQEGTEKTVVNIKKLVESETD
jgi:Polyketide cyclase / dehydrase and lipid transport